MTISAVVLDYAYMTNIDDDDVGDGAHVEVGAYVHGWKAYLSAINGESFVSASYKAFREPNPDDPETDIVYACIEGPEAGAYVRGTARLEDGEASVFLPRHFVNSCVSEGMTVQVTPRSADSKGLAVVERSLEGFRAVELMQGAGDYEFDWEVKAVRKGFQDFQVIRHWTDPPRGTASGVVAGQEAEYAKRLSWVERFFRHRERVERGEPRTSRPQ